MLKSTFNTATELLGYFSFHHLRDVRRDKGLLTLKDCVKTPYPTLSDIKESHGYECACLAVEVFVTNLNDNLNIHRMEPAQISELAELIVEECPGLKLTELHEFFRRVKTAQYGEYYGSIDCVKLMSDFREFLRDRADAAKKLQVERERIIMQRREDKRAKQMLAGEILSREDWKELRWLFNLGYENIKVAK